MNHKWYRPNIKCFKLYFNTISWGNIHFIWFCHFWAKIAIFILVWSIFAYFGAYFPIFWYFYPIFGTLNGLYISGTILWKKLRQFEPYFINHFRIRTSWSRENTKIGYIVWKKNTLGHLKWSKVRKRNFFVTSTTKLTWENYESWWFQRGRG